MAVTQKFKNMALSFYGCDGGNLNSTVWTCGLEWGGGYENNEIPESELKALKLWSWDTDGETVAGCLRHQYNQKLAWFFSYLYGWNVDDYKNESIKNKLFCSEGTGFKMNAFPISFKNRDSVSWSQKIKEQTGIDSFQVYKEWCIENRGKHFHNLIQKHNPQIVLCTGISSSNEFFRFFKCDISTIAHHNEFHSGLTNDGKTLIFVVPFFGGRNGINSYSKMESLVSKINHFASLYFNNDVWFKQYPPKHNK
ncbi:hypothetical protein [Shewanella algae]|uniref:hypothetical protein n=1 Tax=Shewanella algae TaxID=38313 RepID=UPI0031F5CB21